MSLALASVFVLAGCGSAVKVELRSPDTLNLTGTVKGSNQGLAGSTLQLYASGTSGDGSASTPLLSHPIETNAAGEYSLSSAYTCPSANSEVYLVARGGSAGSSSNNSSIALMTALGSCGSLGNVTMAVVNEVTTVGSIWPLAPFAKSATQIGSGSTDVPEFNAAAKTINELVNVTTGTAPGPMLAANQVAPTAKLYTLASIIAACVKSGGGVAGDGTTCGQLFSKATRAGSPPPSDILAAALEIAQNPTQNVTSIFELCPSSGALLPGLSSAPQDWSLPILTVPATPTISPDGGTLAPGQAVSIADATSGASIYYTIDGSVPSAASLPYSEPIALTSSGTLNAVAILDAIASSVASETFNVSPAVTVSLTPTTVALGASQTQAFTASVANTTNTAVAWSLSPAVGAISATGVYTAPASINAAQTVTVTATSVANPSASASSTISLTLAVTVSLLPSTVSLGASQTQVFTASVANTTDTTVTWSLSPAVGSISPTGVYTAPASIPTAQTVAVTATSVANPAVSATSIVSLSPTVAHEVDLSWSPPSISSDPVIGYNVYRSIAGMSTYQLVNVSIDIATSYADTIVQTGLSYDYVVKSVDASGTESSPSNVFNVTIP